jgi:hypothetical protein
MQVRNRVAIGWLAAAVVIAGLLLEPAGAFARHLLRQTRSPEGRRWTP